MKLKSIHMTGFKSFADRTSVLYHDGITGVIGPNGSGKSNIIDAVRWVMGEQTSKNLRADDPTDIIFSGSESRKALGFAEVTLTFRNDGLHCPAEFMHLPEVSIGRRIHRDGEREYFMNREACRLKDIVDFLLSIGLGSKSYAIIQQDKRDRIIQASPEDLREILEETAGITVFKIRRKEAEKRLTSTTERLKSLSEIESELARQKNTLQDQVHKAQLKIEYTEQLKKNEIELIKNHVGFYRSIAEKVRTEIAARHHEIEASAFEASTWEIRANELKAEQLDYMVEIKNSENNLDDCKLALTKFSERLDNYKKNKDDKQKLKERLSAELSDERENILKEQTKQQEYLVSLEKYEKELREIDANIENHVLKLEELDEALQVERINIEEIKSELRAVENSRSSLRIKNESILDSISSLNQNTQRIFENELQHTKLKQELTADKHALSLQLNSISSGLDSVTQEKNEYENEFQDLKKQIDSMQLERDEAKQKLMEVTSHLNSLQKLLEGSEGLSVSAKVLKEKTGEKVCGFLFDHVVLHKDDETILEKYLPYLFQSALIENYDSFVDVIDKCEELSLSKVSLLVKDYILPISQEERTIIGKISELTGIKNVGSRLEKLTWSASKSLFDRIFICSDEWVLLKAKKLSAGFQHFIFISERGTVSQGPYEFTYGIENDEASNLGIMGRKREAALLQNEKELHQGKLALLEGQLFSLTQKKNLFEEKLKEISKILEQEKIESLKITSQIDQFYLQISHHDENLKRLAEEKTKITADIELVKAQFAKNNEQLASLELEQNNLSRRLNDLESDFNDNRSNRDEVQSIIQTKRSTRMVLTERLSNTRQNYEELSVQINRLRNKTDVLSVQIEELTVKISSSDTDYDELCTEVDTIKKKSQEFELQLEELLTSEATVSENLRVFENKIRHQKDAADQKQKFITEKQLELARVETILETAFKDAKEKHGLKVHELPTETPPESQSKHAIENEIRELTQKIAELGAVNERALEEFNDVYGRLTFLITQKDDIERSMTELNQSINEIEESTKSRFKDIFEKVNTEFKKIFPVLFPSGNGQLHMLDEANLLTTGVEILVHLPGKKMQNMSLFSGGEKALTAISLIFSLLKTTPAPFCFLDEVDAPLDEANVGRFNDVLNALSDEFQFVVITHNRRTMEVLDTIYGISMSEPGVSKLVSVDLTDVPEHLRKKQKIAVKPGAEAFV